MRAEELKAILGSMGKRPSKRLGQNFLLDDSVLRRAVEAADLSDKDTVLEIGPGLGNLTEELLRTGAKVVAVEQDPEFCRFLERRFGDRVRLVRADAVKAFLPEFNKVVSNLPYQISSPITFKLLDAGFDTAVLMLQREFAERMVATNGTAEYGRLSVGVYYRSECEILFNVSRASFWPQPKVDSCVVRLVPRGPPFQVDDEDAFFRVTKAIFSHRRKKILNSLLTDPSVASLVEGMEKETLARLPYSDQRAEELSPEMIGQISDALVALRSSSASKRTS
ncbi:MAG: 16S rRNA (adenine(1518)-N(6)/adenine(1519)-N(6))-dimethyltransferase RsmA [Thermoplasmata archaeon]|nr:16S rRNA (adenine(1518)-N(6)/adenine(1519)-N(6))-dimethyltransferase RsmA [Thermoplasmata archaeon]